MMKSFEFEIKESTHVQILESTSVAKQLKTKHLKPFNNVSL